MVIEASEELEVVKSFDELGLREELQRGISHFKFLMQSYNQVYTIYRHIRIRFQQAIRCPAESNSAHN